MEIHRHPLARSIGRVAGRAGKWVLGRVLDVVVPAPESEGLDVLRDVRRILVVRPNFRIGNTLMTTPLVVALRRRFPAARLDYLGGDCTANLLERLPLDRVYCISRRHLLRPWQFVGLFLRLRRERYDLAVEGGLGSFSGGLYAYLTGAPHRLGCAGKADRFLTIRLPSNGARHAYDAVVDFARALGASCPDRPVYRVDERAAAAAVEVLRAYGLVRAGRVRPFVALCPAGHQEKRWALGSWLELARQLCAAGMAVAVFLGPEERAMGAALEGALPPGARLFPPHELQVFAALLASAALVVTPDSGPMHMAVALGRPTIALLQSMRSEMYRPRGPDDRQLLRPSVREVVEVVLGHPAWIAVSTGERPSRNGDQQSAGREPPSGPSARPPRWDVG